MVGTCLCVTNGSFAALSDELESASVSGQGSRCLVDELQLLGFPALSGPSAPVVSLRPACHSCCSRAASVESPQCSVDICVEDETVDSSGASSVRKLVSFSTRCTSLRVCVTPLSCTPASSSSARLVGVGCCWHCSSGLQLAMLFQPLWVRSVPLWLLFSPAVGPLSSVLFTRCGSALFHSLFRSPFASF